MQTDQEFNAERDAYEMGVINNVRQLVQNSDARALISAKLPFVNKTRSFRGVAVFGLESFEPHTDSGGDTIWVSYHARNRQYAPHQYGAFDTRGMPTEILDEFTRDLDDISGYRGNVYVVTSYRTVIAWTRGLNSDTPGALYVPEVTYSYTTTRHQTVARNS